MKHPRTYNFVSSRKLASLLAIDQRRLRKVAHDAPRYYRPFPMMKRGSDKVREIDRPTGELKELQYQIYRRFLRGYDYLPCLHGGIPGRSPLSNAREHVGGRYVVRIDIRNYFRTISHRHVYDAWISLGFSPSLARLLTKLTTYRGYLPQGAPTSMALANLVLRSFDELIRHAIDGNTRYTRFVDDIVLSGEYPQQYVNTILELLHREGFSTRHRKLVIQHPGIPQEVTGYLVNQRTGCSVSKRYRANIRAAIHHIEPQTPPGEIRSIHGRIQHVGTTSPRVAIRLSDQLSNQLKEVDHTLSSGWSFQ